MNGEQFDERTVRIDVIERLQFQHNEPKVGGLIGQSLEVDCTVSNRREDENVIVEIQVDKEPYDVPQEGSETLC